MNIASVSHNLSGRLRGRVRIPISSRSFAAGLHNQPVEPSHTLLKIVLLHSAENKEIKKLLSFNTYFSTFTVRPRSRQQKVSGVSIWLC